MGGNLQYVKRSWRVDFMLGYVVTQKTLHLIFYHPNGLCCKHYHSEKGTKCHQFVELYLLSLFKSVFPSVLSGMTLITIMLRFFEIIKLIKLIIKLYLIYYKHMCFQTSLKLQDLHWQNPAKTFGIFRKNFSGIRGWIADLVAF